MVSFCFEELTDYNNDDPPSKEFFENPWGFVNDTEKTAESQVTKRYATLDHACGRHCGYMAETTASPAATLQDKMIIFKNCVKGEDGDLSRPDDCDEWIPDFCLDEYEGVIPSCLKDKSAFFVRVRDGETRKKVKVFTKPSLEYMLEYEALDYMLCGSLSTERYELRCDWGYDSRDSKLLKSSPCENDLNGQSCCGSGSGFEGELATQPQAMANESNGVAAIVVVAVAAVAGIVGVVGMALKKGSITKPMTTTDV